MPTPQGSSWGLRGPHVSKPPPHPPSMSLPRLQAPPSLGLFLSPLSPSEPQKVGRPALPLHPISLHGNLPDDFILFMPLNTICMPATPVHLELSESSPGCRLEHSAADPTRPLDRPVHLHRAEAGSELLPGRPPHRRKQAPASSCSGLSPGPP